MKHNREELKQFQSLSMESKIHMSATRIKGWINEFGEDGVYISFSGGKDSTVLMDIIRNQMGINIPAAFVNVPTQFPELKEFAMTWDNVEILQPKMSFYDVCDKYGFPLISKEISLKVNIVRKNPTTSKYLRFFDGSQKGISIFDCSKYSYMLDAPFNISNKCCDELKKKPLYKYEKETGRHTITATMASESFVRAQKWLQHGCNGFDLKRPVSNPLSFWTEQDILQYIYDYKLPICSLYGDVIEENGIFSTTGCDRTGCMVCGFGCHMKDDDRFLQLKETHPQMYSLLDIMKNNGVTFREAIEWTNEHGNFDIKL